MGHCALCHYVAREHCCDPINILGELLIKWSKARYLRIISSALLMSDQAGPEDKEIFLLRWLVYAVGWLIIGYIWTHIKLFLEVWKGTLPRSLDEDVRAVYARKESYLNFVVRIKWLVLEWMFTWPISMLFTLVQHPFRIVADFVYDISRRKYMWIVDKAMRLRQKEE